MHANIKVRDGCWRKAYWSPSAFTRQHQAHSFVVVVHTLSFCMALRSFHLRGSDELSFMLKVSLFHFDGNVTGSTDPLRSVRVRERDDVHLSE